MMLKGFLSLLLLCALNFCVCASPSSYNPNALPQQIQPEPLDHVNLLPSQMLPPCLSPLGQMLKDLANADDEQGMASDSDEVGASFVPAGYFDQQMLFSKAIDGELKPEIRRAFERVFLLEIDRVAQEGLLSFPSMQNVLRQIRESNLSSQQKYQFERAFMMRAGLPYIDFSELDLAPTDGMHFWRKVIEDAPKFFDRTLGLGNAFTLQPLKDNKKLLGYWICDADGVRRYLLKLLSERGRDEAKHLSWASRYLENYGKFAMRDMRLPRVPLPEIVFGYDGEDGHMIYAALLHVAKGDAIYPMIAKYLDEPTYFCELRIMKRFLDFGRKLFLYESLGLFRHGDAHGANILRDNQGRYSFIDLETAVWSFLDKRLSDKTRDRRDFYYQDWGREDSSFFVSSLIHFLEQDKEQIEEDLVEKVKKIKRNLPLVLLDPDAQYSGYHPVQQKIIEKRKKEVIAWYERSCAQFQPKLVRLVNLIGWFMTGYFEQKNGLEPGEGEINDQIHPKFRQILTMRFERGFQFSLLNTKLVNLRPDIDLAALFAEQGI